MARRGADVLPMVAVCQQLRPTAYISHVDRKGADAMKHDLEGIKRRLTIPQVAAALFPAWRPKVSCHSPFRTDKKESFSVYQNGEAYKDHATGESGDVIAFYMAGTGLPFANAVERLACMAGLHEPKPTTTPNARLMFPNDFHVGHEAELEQVSRTRRISFDAVRIASERGLIGFGTVARVPCWIVTDKARKAAQARRMDGLPFDAIGSLPARKAHTLKGSSQSWPVGILEAQPFPAVAIVEGGPDLLAAFHFAYAEELENRVAVVAMLGASNDFPPDTIQHFTGKRIRIFAHADNPGIQAAKRWKAQLEAVAPGRVDIVSCGEVELTDGTTSDDLNDLARMTAEAFHDDRDLWHLFEFAEEVTP